MVTEHEKEDHKKLSNQLPSAIAHSGIPVPSFHIGCPDDDDSDKSAVLKQQQHSSGGPTTSSSESEEGGDGFGLDPFDDDSIASSTEEEQEESSLSLQEKATKNKQRNAQFLDVLNKKYKAETGAPSPAKQRSTKSRKSNVSNAENDYVDVPRGMLLSQSHRIFHDSSIMEKSQDSSSSFPTMVQALMSKYPHRSIEIRKLVASLLHVSPDPTLVASNNICVHVPAPLFVLGPSGTGKTSIVQDVVQTVTLLHQKQQSDSQRTTNSEGAFSRMAYINCATLDPCSIERLVVSIFDQLVIQHSGGDPSYLPLKKRRRQPKSSHHKGSGTDQNSDTTAHEVGSSSTKENTIPSEDVQLSKDPEADTTREPDDSDGKDRRVQPRRDAKKSIEGVELPSNQTKKQTQISDEAVESSHSAVVALGRSLQPYFGMKGKGRATLILDNADRLLSLDPSESQPRCTKTNHLSEFMLLPKMSKVNLAIVAISSNHMIQTSRLSLTTSPSASLVSVLTAICPVTVQFSAYRGKEVWKEVLSTAVNRARIVGHTGTAATSSSFLEKATNAFINSMIQFFSGTITNVSELIHAGRCLWPVFTLPIQPKNVRSTMETIGRTNQTTEVSHEHDIITHLQLKFLTHIGKEGLMGGTMPSAATSRDDIIPTAGFPSVHRSKELQPYWRSCLLLAFFFCQNNHAKQDKKVFSSAGSGKRKKKQHGQDDDEGLDQLKSVRPRAFLVERALSIFVTLVKRNPNPLLSHAIHEEQFDLGSPRLHRDICFLVHLGHLHRARCSAATKETQVNLNHTKYWCSLLKEDAMVLAKQIGVPLDEYLV